MVLVVVVVGRLGGGGETQKLQTVDDCVTERPAVSVEVPAPLPHLLSPTRCQVGRFDANEARQVNEDQTADVDRYLRLRTSVMKIQNDDRHADRQRTQRHRCHQIDNCSATQQQNSNRLLFSTQLYRITTIL